MTAPKLYKPKYAEAAYLAYDPFAGDDVAIEFREIKIVGLIYLTPVRE